MIKFMKFYTKFITNFIIVTFNFIFIIERIINSSYHIEFLPANQSSENQP